jgi:catechol 2,3-dioxygenase-like lactoylglutathione lyase family enzyme
MTVKMERISAITLKVSKMEVSVQFYGDLLGMKLVYGGKDALFSSLRTADAGSPILNLEQGSPTSHWGRMIFHVADVDAFWTLLRERGFDPEKPQDASWGERYFHMNDPDGHELSFAHPL